MRRGHDIAQSSAEEQHTKTANETIRDAATGVLNSPPIK